MTSRRLTGQVPVLPSNDPKDAFERHIDIALEAGEVEQAYGLCIGLALIWCAPIEDIWEQAQGRQLL